MRTVSVFALVFALVPDFALAQSGRQPVVLHLAFDLDFYPNLFKGINNVPLFVRQVPIHDDDPEAGDIVTINSSSVTISTMNTFGFQIGPQFRTEKFSFKVCPIFTYVMRPNYSTGTFQEANYNSGRSQGSSFVFYSVGVVTGWKHPGIAGEAGYRIGGPVHLVLGYKFVPFRVVLKNGWDRYDDFEVNRVFDLSRNRMQSVYAGIGIGPVILTTGPSYHQAEYTDLGRAVGLRHGTRLWKFGAGLTTSW